MSPSPAGRAEIRRDMAVLAAGAAFLFFVALGARDLWNPNEPTYGKAVVEMAARGDWIVPTVNGSVFAEKPILYYWLALVSSRLMGGPHELALRVPSAAAGVLGVVLVYLLVLPYAGRARARWAAAVFATTFLVFWTARSVQMDLLVSVAILGTVLCATRVVDHGAAPLRGFAQAGLAAGLGFLAKGPVAWIAPVLVLGAYGTVTRRLRAVARPHVVAGVVPALVVGGAWLAALWARGETGAIREAFFRQNVTRFLDPWDHAGVWWYYLYYFWIDLAPWAWFVPLAAALPARDDDERRLDRLAWCWLLAILLFFSLSGSKRSPYILPAAPAVAVLVSGLLERLFDGRLSVGRRRAVLALLGVAGVAATLAGLLVIGRVSAAHPALSLPAEALAALLVAGGLALLASVALRRVAHAAVALFALVLSCELFAAAVALPAVDALKSVRPFCERVRAVAGADGEVASFAFWEFRGSYGFYLGRTIPNLATDEALRAYWSSPDRVFVIVEATHLDRVRTVVGPREPLVRAGVGQNTAYLFANR